MSSFVKKLFIVVVTVVVAVLAVNAYADTIYIPDNSQHVDYAEYSTGGGKTIVHYVKVLITHDDGSQSLYTAKKNKGWGGSWLSRDKVPPKMDFKEKPGLRDAIIWEDE